MELPREPTQQATANKLSPLRRLERHLSRRVVSGFLVLVPLLITVWVLYLAFSFVDGAIRGESGILRSVIRDSPWDFWGLGVIIALVVFYITGAFLAGKRVRAWEDSLIGRIPIFGAIYRVSRQSIDALSTSAGHRFSRVVFVEWPRPGVRALGFVTGRLHPGIQGDSSTIVVYIPTVPNPTSGMLAWLPEEQVFASDMTVEDAMKAVFSGGIVLPEMSLSRGIPAMLHDEETGAGEPQQV
jgi:uncharacterized membrane protein